MKRRIIKYEEVFASEGRGRMRLLCHGPQCSGPATGLKLEGSVGCLATHMGGNLPLFPLLTVPLSLVPPPSLLGSATALECACVILAGLSPDLAGFPFLGKDIPLELPPRSDEEGSTF